MCLVEAFWGLATMLLLLLGASLSTPGSGLFGSIALELRDDDGHWSLFSGVGEKAEFFIFHEAVILDP